MQHMEGFMLLSSLFLEDTIPDPAHLRGFDWKILRQFVQDTVLQKNGWLVSCTGKCKTSLLNDISDLAWPPLLRPT